MSRGTWKRSEEFKSKLSKICKEKGIGKWMTGKKLTEKTKRKMSQNSAKYFLGKKLSDEHIYNLSISHLGKTGEKASNWKGGLTSKNRIVRHSIETKLWRESVFVRDNYTCQKTKIRGGKLHPHHIKNFAEYPELRFAIDNGITFSEKAHEEFHNIYGRKNNTLEQVLEFIYDNVC